MKKKQGFSVMAAALVLTLAFTGAGAAFTGCPASNEGDSTDAGPGTGSGPGTDSGLTTVTFERAVIAAGSDAAKTAISTKGEADVILTFKGADSGLEADDFVVTISSPSSPDSVEKKDGTSLSKEEGSNTRYKLTINLNGTSGPTLLEILNGGSSGWVEGADKGVLITVTMNKTGYTFTKSTERVEFLALSKFSGENGAGDNIIDVIKSAANGSVIDAAGVEYDEDDDSLILTLPQAAETETVQLGAANLLSAGLVLDATTNNSPAEVTINGNGRVIDLTGSATGSPLITVGAGVTLTLTNITFKGLKSAAHGGTDTYDNNNSLIRVEGGKLILEDGAVISDNTNTLYGGGVYLTSGSLSMNDGSEIRSNSAQFGGGVRIGEESVFIMEGGTISGNTAASEYGGGAHVKDNSNFTMTSGIISNNSAAKGGGGVNIAIDSTFTMKGGEIKNNTAKHWGGGVLISASTFVLTGNGLITENTTNAGTTKTGGGGVFLEIGSTFTMTGGTISLNQAKGQGVGGNGGGVWADTDCKFGKTDGTIYGSLKADGVSQEDENVKNTANVAATAAIRIGLTSNLKERQKTSDATNVLYYNYDDDNNPGTDVVTSGWD